MHLHPPVLHASGIAKAYGSRRLWHGIDVTVPRGGSLAITGPSGSGKSTLVRCLGLLEHVDMGRIEILGETVTHVTSRRRMQLYRSTIGHLFQNGALEDTWTVRQNLDVAFIGSTLRGRARVPVRQDALAQVGITAPDSATAHTLSGGERQRLAIARLLIRRPPVVLADEPTAALDAATGSDILQRLSDLRDGGSAIVVATHDPAVVDWADECLDLGSPVSR
ncbi:ATP-binding cassette domain-containing protein [Curtobacterium ammoniigenes]|uniref:ATP-binding cassette domain-containing protein n=1 Tax=Curtobacterium ammoniigenes TaxID=395387 RepID=UPI000835E6F0|nr:ATP-binding cassette domain-containing protein [Curtobacterium ammoniigenes]